MDFIFFYKIFHLDKIIIFAPPFYAKFLFRVIIGNFLGVSSQSILTHILVTAIKSSKQRFFIVLKIK